jgi:hypothetical protein
MIGAHDMRVRTINQDETDGRSIDFVRRYGSICCSRSLKSEVVGAFRYRWRDIDHRVDGEFVGDVRLWYRL